MENNNTRVICTVYRDDRPRDIIPMKNQKEAVSFLMKQGFECLNEELNVFVLRDEDRKEDTIATSIINGVR